MNRTPSPHLQHLRAFEGTWTIEGRNYKAAPDGADQPVHGKDHCYWLEGQFFMINDWQHLVEGGGHIGMSVLGYDEEAQRLFTRGFDNIGFDRRYFLEADGNTWTYVGDTERAVRTYDASGNSFSEHWELKDESGNWQPLCVMNGVREGT